MNETEQTTSRGLVIDWIGGNCPVQAEGRVDGEPFYFRARGDAWSMDIGPGPAGDLFPGSWSYEEDYGDWPAAGWMPEDEARAFIDKAVALYRQRQPTPTNSSPLNG